MMKSYKITILVSILILIALLMPPSGIPSVGPPWIDKVVHFGIFGFLCVIYFGEHYYHHQQLPNIPKSMLYLVSYAILTEVLQYLSGYRTFDIYDIIADTVGIVIGIAFSKVCFQLYGNKKF